MNLSSPPRPVVWGYAGGIFVERAEQISIGLMPNVRSIQSGLLPDGSRDRLSYTANPRSQPVPDNPQTPESDMSKILTSALVALFVTASVPALAQSSGGGSGAGAAGGSGSASGSAEQRRHWHVDGPFS